MKPVKLILLLTTIFLRLSSIAQECQFIPQPFTVEVQSELKAGTCLSQNGYCHTPKSNIHIMYVVVDFNNEQPDGESSWWPEDGVPNYAALNGNPNNLLDINVNNPTNNDNLTTWYRTMSANNFSITGEIFKAKIDRQYFNGQIDFHKMTEDAFLSIQHQYPNRDWSEFDKRQNSPNFGYDNSVYNSDGSPASGDGKIDFVFISFRMSVAESTTNARGYNAAGIWGNPSLTTTFGGGKTYSTSFNCAATLCNVMREEHLKEYFSVPSQPTRPLQEKSMCSEGGLASVAVTSKEEMNQNGVFTFELVLTNHLFLITETTNGKATII